VSPNEVYNNLSLVVKELKKEVFGKKVIENKDPLVVVKEVARKYICNLLQWMEEYLRASHIPDSVVHEAKQYLKQWGTTGDELYSLLSMLSENETLLGVFNVMVATLVQAVLTGCVRVSMRCLNTSADITVKNIQEQYIKGKGRSVGELAASLMALILAYMHEVHIGRLVSIERVLSDLRQSLKKKLRDADASCAINFIKHTISSYYIKRTYRLITRNYMSS